MDEIVDEKISPCSKIEIEPAQKNKKRKRN
jgi:hypothetical protein